MKQNEFYRQAVFEQGEDENWGLVTHAQNQHRLASMHRYGFCARNRSSPIEPGRTIRGASDFIRHAQIQAFYVSHQSGCTLDSVSHAAGHRPHYFVQKAEEMLYTNGDVIEGNSHPPQSLRGNRSLRVTSARSSDGNRFRLTANRVN